MSRNTAVLKFRVSTIRFEIALWSWIEKEADHSNRVSTARSVVWCILGCVIFLYPNSESQIQAWEKVG